MKYLNKGLLYEWFNSAKIPTIIGLFVWSISTYAILQGKIFNLKREISNSFSNYFLTESLRSYFILGIIFLAVYFVAQGANKRNMTMFLSSGPYTNRQIKYNELICSLLTIIPFILVYIYMGIMAYIRNREFLLITEGYSSMLFIEILRLILIGTILILFMIIVDSVFSNSVIGFISMITIIPFSIYIILIKIINIIEYSSYNAPSFLRDIMGYNNNIENPKSMLLNAFSLKVLNVRQLLIDISILITIIVIMIIIFNLIQKKYKLELSNKIFSSRLNENIIIGLVSIATGSYTSLIFLSNYINRMQQFNGGDLSLSNLDLVKGLGADFLCIGIVGFIAFKLIKKIIKNIL